MKNLFRKFRKEQLIETCFESVIDRTKIKIPLHYKKNMLPKEYLDEHLTYKLYFPRQSGHTSCIKKYSKCFENPIIFVPRFSFIGIYHDVNNVYSAETIKLDSITHIDAIFVDMASYTTKSGLDNIYKFAIRQHSLKMLLFVQ